MVKFDIMDSAVTKPLQYSVVVPVLNEESNLPILHDRLTALMHGLGQSYEIIYIDDGSTDNSFQILSGLHERDDNVVVIQFTRNFGQTSAVLAGFSASKGKIVINLDADLQNPPEEIPKLINKLDEDFEVAFGVFQQRKHPAFRRLGSRFTKWIMARILPVENTGLSGFKAMRFYVVDQLKMVKDTSIFLSGIICWMGYKVCTVEVKHSARLSGKTKYNLYKLVTRWMDMIVSYSDFPLKIAIGGGFVLGMVAFILALYYITKYFLYGIQVPGFTTIIIILTFFTGVQLFFLGIIGEYISRVNAQVKGRPLYIVRTRLD